MNGTTPLSLVKQEGKRALENTLTCFLFQRNFSLIFNQQELMMKNRVPFWFREKKSSSREWSTQTIFWCKMLLRTQKSVQVYRRCIAVFGRSFDWNMTEMAALICRICLKYHLQFTDIRKPFFSISSDWFNFMKSKVLIFHSLKSIFFCFVGVL